MTSYISELRVLSQDEKREYMSFYEKQIIYSKSDELFVQKEDFVRPIFNIVKCGSILFSVLLEFKVENTLPTDPEYHIHKGADFIHLM